MWPDHIWSEHIVMPRSDAVLSYALAFNLLHYFRLEGPEGDIQHCNLYAEIATGVHDLYEVDPEASVRVVRDALDLAFSCAEAEGTPAPPKGDVVLCVRRSISVPGSQRWNPGRAELFMREVLKSES